MNKAKWLWGYKNISCPVHVFELNVPYQGHCEIEISYSPYVNETMAFPIEGHFDNPPNEIKGNRPVAMLESMGYQLCDE